MLWEKMIKTYKTNLISNNSNINLTYPNELASEIYAEFP